MVFPVIGGPSRTEFSCILAKDPTTQMRHDVLVGGRWGTKSNSSDTCDRRTTWPRPRGRGGGDVPRIAVSLPLPVAEGTVAAGDWRERSARALYFDSISANFHRASQASSGHPWDCDAERAVFRQVAFRLHSGPSSVDGAADTSEGDCPFRIPWAIRKLRTAHGCISRPSAPIVITSNPILPSTTRAVTLGSTE